MIIYLNRINNNNNNNLLIILEFGNFISERKGKIDLFLGSNITPDRSHHHVSIITRDTIIMIK